MGITKADRDSINSAVMRRFKLQEARMIAHIDAFRSDIPNKKQKEDNKRKSKKP